MNAMEFGEIPYLRSLCNLGSASLSHDSEVTSQCPHNFPKGVEILQVKHSQSHPRLMFIFFIEITVDDVRVIALFGNSCIQDTSVIS